MVNDEHVTEPQERAVLFVDICDSTSLYERLGDRAAAARVMGCLERLADCVAEYGGRVIQRVGDELMCAFPTCESALDSAVTMQGLITAEQPQDDIPISLRIGCHFGAVIEDAGDLFGDVVNVGARAAAFAPAGTVIVTEDVVDRVSWPMRHHLRKLGRFAVKGKQLDVGMYELLWRDQSRETIRRPPPGPWTELRLTLRCDRESVELGSHHRRVATIGRDATCDIVVRGDRVSRRHARVELRNAKFVVIDQSLNGTCVEMAGQTISLHREELIISGRGRIHFGEPETCVIEFACG